MLKYLKKLFFKNKATKPQAILFGRKKYEQFDVRSEGGAVGVFRTPFQKVNKKDLSMKNKT